MGTAASHSFDLAAWRERLRVLCAGCSAAQLDLQAFDAWRRGPGLA